MLKNALGRCKARRRRGDTTIVIIGIAAAIMLFGLFMLELQELYDIQYAVEVRAQRAINSCVEYAMDERLRSDGYNYMDVAKAQSKLKTFLDEDLNVDSSGRCYDDNGDLIYTVRYGTPTFYKGNGGHGAGIDIEITVTMQAGLGKAFSMDGYTWTNLFQSVNFRTDNDVRKGV